MRSRRYASSSSSTSAASIVRDDPTAAASRREKYPAPAPRSVTCSPPFETKRADDLVRLLPARTVGTLEIARRSERSAFDSGGCQRAARAKRMPRAERADPRPGSAAAALRISSFVLRGPPAARARRGASRAAARRTPSSPPDLVRDHRLDERRVLDAQARLQVRVQAVVDRALRHRHRERRSSAISAAISFARASASSATSCTRPSASASSGRQMRQRSMNSIALAERRAGA